MDKIITTKKAIELSKKIHSDNKTIVMTGGCFDILHLGHIKFLEEAKKTGDFLFLLLESDKSVKKMKGKDRPINNQKERSYFLSKLTMVDFVVLLKEMTKDVQYDKLMSQIKPNVLATTKGDPNLKHKERQVKIIGTARIKFVTKRIPKFSSSGLARNYRK